MVIKNYKQRSAGVKQTKFIVVLLTMFLSSASKPSVLFIGDSHSVGIFGKRFDQLIRQSESEVITHTSCGAIGKWFRTGQKTYCGYFNRTQNGTISSGKTGSTPILDQTISTFSPEVIIIELGGNYTNRGDQYSIEDIDNLVTYINDQGIRCLWIGPPSSRGNERTPRLYRLIKEGVKGRCPIFNSSEVTTYPSDPNLDGIHYWGKEGKRQALIWATKAHEFYMSQEN